MHVYIYEHVYSCFHVELLLCGVDAFSTYTRIHVSIHVYIYKYWGRCFLYVNIFSDESMYAYIYEHIYIYMHMYIYIYMSKRES